MLIKIYKFLIIVIDGDWGLGPIPNPQTPKPKTQNPI